MYNNVKCIKSSFTGPVLNTRDGVEGSGDTAPNILNLSIM
jgi:hypothetical protein